MTPEQEQTLQRLKEIRASINKNSDHIPVWRELNELIPSLPIPPDKFSNQPDEFTQGNHAQNWLYRANFIKPGHKRWDKAGDVSYLPREYWKDRDEFGRVNKPHTGIFYASLNLLAACAETYTSGPNLETVRREESVQAIVGQWVIKAPLSLIRMPIPESTITFFDDPRIEKLGLSTITPDVIRKQNAHIREVCNDEFKFKLLEFFAEAFAHQGDEQYLLSTYYADRVFNKIEGFRTQIETSDGKVPKEIEGILYYACPSSYQELNLALLPESVDAKRIEIVFAHHMVWSHSYSHGRTLFVPHEQNALIRDGEIKWRKSYNDPSK